ncbi:MAG TPA: diphosphomevalonate decarboxylase [Polyangiaceae bacterium]|jgi:diphosphomevalonate decarboxylase
MSARSRPTFAVAHPNIALAKYWGKRAGAGNYPAVPSLSVTLAGLETRTRLELRDDVPADRLVLNGEVAKGKGMERAAALFDRVRAAAGITSRMVVESTNDFPTASGLASSASGFAALAVAAVRAAGLDWGADRISDLARRGSASAARSLFGGFVELEGVADEAPLGPEGLLAARPVASPEQLPLRILVCVATESAKTVGSTEGMRATASSSPYHAGWLAEGPRIFHAMKKALAERDFAAVGELAERSALAMHANALAGGVVYWSGVTLEALSAVRALRARGTPAFATMDAGPHVKVIVKPEDAALVGTWMRAVPGVLRVIECEPGEGARVVEEGAP